MIKGPLKTISDPSLNSKMFEGLTFRNGHMISTHELGIMFDDKGKENENFKRASDLKLCDTGHLLAQLNIHKTYGTFNVEFYVELIKAIKERNPNDLAFKRAKIEE